MRTSALLFIILLVAASNAAAQLFKFGPGLEYAAPMGNFADRVGSGIGGVGQLRFDLPFVTVLGAVDYIKFSEKEATEDVGGTFVTAKRSAEMWGLNAGATLGLLPMIYGGAEVGTYFVTERTEESGTGTDHKVTLGAFAPLVGVSFGRFDVSARYVFLKDSDFLLLRGVVLF